MYLCGVSIYNCGQSKDHLPVSCQDKFGTSNLVQRFEEDWRHKWDCQWHRLQATPAAKMRLKIHRVLILRLEQSKIPHIKAILMYTVPEV